MIHTCKWNLSETYVHTNPALFTRSLKLPWINLSVLGGNPLVYSNASSCMQVRKSFQRTTPFFFITIMTCLSHGGSWDSPDDLGCLLEPSSLQKAEGNIKLALGSQTKVPHLTGQSQLSVRYLTSLLRLHRRRQQEAIITKDEIWWSYPLHDISYICNVVLQTVAQTHTTSEDSLITVSIQTAQPLWCSVVLTVAWLLLIIWARNRHWKTTSWRWRNTYTSKLAALADKT